VKFFGVFKCCEEITKKEFYSQAVSSSMKLQTQFFYLWYYVSLPKMPHPFFTNLQRAESIVVVEELQVFSFMEHLPYEELLQCCCQSCILLFLSTSSSLLPVRLSAFQAVQATLLKHRLQTISAKTVTTTHCGRLQTYLQAHQYLR
jgi:hypothetical protein